VVRNIADLADELSPAGKSCSTFGASNPPARNENLIENGQFHTTHKDRIADQDRWRLKCFDDGGYGWSCGSSGSDLPKLLIVLGKLFSWLLSRPSDRAFRARKRAISTGCFGRRPV